VLADLGTHLSYPLALAAGLASFLSPCVFPLAPAYLAYLGGRAGGGATAIESSGGGGVAVVRRGPGGVDPRVSLLGNGVAFVLGFSCIFIAFFYVLVALRVTLLIHHQQTVNLVAGLIIILLALQTLGLLRIGLLMREQRLHLSPPGAGLLPSFLLGVTFAAGWTPCIGPQLSAILTVASGGDFSGLPVMIVYCLGLAVPFLLMAALADRLQGVIRAVNRHLRVINLVAGALLLVFGVLLITNHFTFFNRFAAQSPFDL